MIFSKNEESGDPVKIPPEYIYIIYTVALGIMAFAVVPRSEIRRLSMLVIIYGALGDVLLIFLGSHLLRLGGYINYYPFGFMGIPFFPLLAWVCYYIMYLYFLPINRPWNIIYTILASGYGTIFANILSNLGIFELNYGKLLLPFIIYLTWNSIVTFTYQNHFRDKDFH